MTRVRSLLGPALLLAPLAAVVPLSMAGAAPPKAPAAAAKGAGEFNEAITQGSVKYVAKEYPAAVDFFRTATQAQPRNPLGYYLLGEALLATGSLPDAETAWLQGEQVSDSGPPAVKGKLLFVLADLRERQGKWDDAKAAWKRYSDFVASAGDAGGFIDSAAARIRDIEAMQKQYKDYAIVRKRIREEDGGALGKLPPAEQP